ncbi:PREDICTED: APO protein 3, mitochondrial-like [Nelumbo nucifera]|uniref:APO protein 3, mitochondrial-like n=2 Tax=Nelumbo nucifera TaxID=4432 RepID=A0A1U8Q869_NELNU|nr:PREDICTED: APO protein 3, mitochondrial-like [Nelumbo nucifera]XP_010269551.1 PREDICTED: APO protein 3, mitochondrial-like [Nelumbo nucifera]XP_019054802.1 PREDICTED: APO protein 3, mitochondrial-like [Nelumbo nucifera]DAD33298.1 TPA_asm: hypothetical protein HUJ06_012149 [Nelumbo nucifera]
MLPRGTGIVRKHRKAILQSFFGKLIGRNGVIQPFTLYSTGSLEAPKCIEMPGKLKKSERKPLVTAINELKHKARLERQMRQQVHEIALQPPNNGLLVKSLVPIAHEVYAARADLFRCVLRIIDSVPVQSCSMCGEVHVGLVPHKIRTCNVAGSPANKEHSWKRGGIEHILPLVESFHLYDRLGRAVSHEERLQVDRIPAIVELCVQAGLDIPECPTRRRAFPVYNVAGRMIDFERRFPKDDISGKDIKTIGFWERTKKQGVDTKPMDLPYDDLKGFALRGMEAWDKMRSGALKLMQKYTVQTCGYCPEVQVGPKGHRVRQCQAYKHQMRDGQHAWQEATIDDLIPPVYVWHVKDTHSDRPLVDGLKRYYGKLPAAVELFAQAGVHVGENYTGIMREDVAVPDLEEEKWVV